MELFINCQNGKKRYIAKYGYHFNNKLQSYASKLLLNDDGSDHSFTNGELADFMRSKGAWFTYDFAYLCNFYYSKRKSKNVQQVKEEAFSAIQNISSDTFFGSFVKSCEKSGIRIKWDEFI